MIASLSQSTRGAIYFGFLASELADKPYIDYRIGRCTKKEQLKNIVKSLLNGSTEHSEDELNAVIYEIYGLTKEEIAVVEATIR